MKLGAMRPLQALPVQWSGRLVALASSHLVCPSVIRHQMSDELSET